MEETSIPSASATSGNPLQPPSSGIQSSSEEREPSSSLSPEEEPPSSEDDDAVDSAMQVSPNGTQYWTPSCSDELKPCTGMTFPSVEAATKFNYSYGVHCRFDIRWGCTKRGRDGVVTVKYIYCNKEGFNKMQSFVTLNGKKTGRRCASSRCGCEAKVVIKCNGNFVYFVTDFVERHNHRMASVNAAQFLKFRRKMEYEDRQFLFDCGNVNIGPTRAYKICKQLAVVKGALSSIFWADSTSQKNFHAFGDVMTFDATYSLNRYNMIFVPFTCVDNHKKFVSFAAALLSSENAESYTWILECFKKCMGRALQIVLTEQDHALWVVVPNVMPNAHHRYCIWHIMKKLLLKVRFNTPLLQEFRSKLKTIVYDHHVHTEEFEYKWNQLVAEYDMGGNKWLCHMFAIRKFWIPAYFRDIPLGGLLRTTSRSESANSFFGSFLNARMTLFAFFLLVFMVPLKASVTLRRCPTMKI
ncbi:hypothetical protein QQ045_019826 [Rhodiola kirilowii]